VPLGTHPYLVFRVGVAGAAAVVEDGDDGGAAGVAVLRAQLRAVRLRGRAAEQRGSHGRGGAGLHDLAAAGLHGHHGREGRGGARERQDSGRACEHCEVW
jgi:hypothetical protein